MALAITLRYLAGGALIDQVIIFDVTLPTIYRLVKNTLENLFDILPPFELRQALKERETNPARLEAITAGFAARSAQMLQGCIGAIDGLLVPIKRPGHLEYERAFYTRKNFYAMNVQAIADVRGRIIHAQVAATPGACHDSYAWRQDQLSKDLLDGPIAEWLREHKRYLIGDDAYPLSHTMVVPWPGKHEASSAELAFNERHSSARISVECAFGMLSRKWLFLKRPFELSLERTDLSCGFHTAVTVAMKLHNLCISDESSLSTDLLDADVSGEHENEAKPRAQRLDHRSRAQLIDPDIAHLSSPNPRLARAERLGGDKEAGKAVSKAEESAATGIRPGIPTRSSLHETRSMVTPTLSARRVTKPPRSCATREKTSHASCGNMGSRAARQSTGEQRRVRGRDGRGKAGAETREFSRQRHLGG